MKLFAKIWPIILLTVLLLVYFLPALTGGTFVAAGMHSSDLMLFNYPLKVWYQQQLHSGQLPFWTTLVGNGFPVLAEGQIGAFYPFHLLLFYFLPVLLAFNLNIFLHFLMAAGFTYLLCRRTFKLSQWASLLAGLVYALSGFFILHIQQLNIDLVIAYLPLDWWLVEKIYREKKLKWALLLALVFALQIFAGHIEMFYYCWLLTGAFLLGLIFTGQQKQSGKALALFFLASLLTGGLTAVQLLPTGELLGSTNRAGGVDYQVSASSAWPLESLEVFIHPRKYHLFQPDISVEGRNSPLVNGFNVYGYLGLLPLALAGLALIKIKASRPVLILTVMLGLAYLWGIGKGTQLFAILWQIVPGMKFFRYPIKILFFIEFGLAVLAGFGLDIVLQQVKSWFSKSTNQPPGVNIISVFGLLVIMISFADLYYHNCSQQPIIPASQWFAPPEFVSYLQSRLEKEDFRIYSFANLDYQEIGNHTLQQQFQNLLFPNFNMIYAIPSSQSLFAAFLDRPVTLMYLTGLGIEEHRLIVPPPLKKVLDLQSVRYFISGLPLEDADFTLVDQVKLVKETQHYALKRLPSGQRQAETAPMTSLYLYQNQTPDARFQLVNQYRVISPDQVLEVITDPAFDPSKEVILEQPPEGGVGEQDLTVADVQLIDYQSQRVEVKTKSDQPTFLVINDSYYPGWQAEVDGHRTEIYPANYAFRAVPVPEGEHQVKLVYRSTYFQLGMMISLVTLIIWSGGMVVSWGLKKQ